MTKSEVARLPEHGAPWPTVPAASAGLAEATLAEAAGVAKETNSTAFLVGCREGLVVDNYWRAEGGFEGPMRAPTYLEDGRSVEDVASVQKSVVSVMVGIALQKGLLRLDDVVSDHAGEGWSRAESVQERAITLRHLLTMTSGLDWQSRYVAEPGTVWDYNLGSVWHTLKPVLERVTAAPLNDLLDAWLGEPLGFEQSSFAGRPADDSIAEQMRGAFQYPDGRPIEGYMTTARDLMRFGLAVLGGGATATADLGIAPGYLEESLTPSTDLNPSYGYLWWLNGQAFSIQPVTGRRDGPVFPGAPASTVSALGALQRAMHVIPSAGLVVVRMGGEPPAGNANREDMLSMLNLR